MPGGWEPGHVRSDLGDEQVRGGLADPRDLIQPLDRVGERGDQLGKLGVELGQVGIQRVHPGQQLGQQEGVLVGEEPGERLLQQRQLGAHPSTGQLRQTLGSRSPATSAASMARPETPKLSLATTLGLIWASSSSLLDPLGLGSPRRHQIGSVAGQVPQLPDRSWGNEAGPQHLPLGELAQPDRIQRVGLGTPGKVLDVTGMHQPPARTRGLPAGSRPPFP